MQDIPESIVGHIKEQGFCVVPKLFGESELLEIQESLQNTLIRCGIDSEWNSEEAANKLRDKSLQTLVYDQLQTSNDRIRVALSSRKFQRLCGLLFEKPILYQKAPFRIDVPLDLGEMTLWHQDYYYVKGNTKTITIYMPLLDLDYLGGALSVAPSSHLLGEIEHDQAWGKKNYPSRASQLNHIACPLQRGDCIAFNSLLLHQTNPNLRNRINFNIQYRISEANLLHDARMGERLEVSVD